LAQAWQERDENAARDLATRRIDALSARIDGDAQACVA